jgi:hypothetical protein
MDLEVGWGANDWIWLVIGTGDDAYECGNELSGSIKCEEFFDWLRTC